MSQATTTPDFSKFETSSIQRRVLYDRLFYGLCVMVSALSIFVLGILLSTIILSALPVIGPHTDSFESVNRLAIIQSEENETADEQFSPGDLIQGVFDSNGLLRGGLGESNDEHFESGSLIGVYSFEIKESFDDDDYGLNLLQAGQEEKNIVTMLKSAGFQMDQSLSGSAAVVLLENTAADVELDEFNFESSLLNDGKIAGSIAASGDWKPRMVLGFSADSDFAELNMESLEIGALENLRTDKRAGKLNCLFSILYDSKDSKYKKVRNLSKKEGRLISGDVRVEAANVVGISRRKNRRNGFDLGGNFELEYCPVPETDASAAQHAANFVRETTKTHPADAGIGPAMVGSLWVILGCVLFALPIGIATAVYLEEFKPTNRILLFFHSLVQINIANLAGVPSIVYGILGLTAFVYMFGDVSDSSNRPTGQPMYSIGAKNYYQFLTEGSEPILIPVSDPETPPELVDGMDAQTTAGEKIKLKIIGPDEEYPEDEAVLKFALSHDAEGGTISRKPWYYLQIPFGRGVLAASLTLMLVILPVVIIASQEALRAVPSSLREGALGLGSTQWQVVRKITLPAAIPSIMTGAILAMSRAIGEAAPILILCGIVYVTSGPSHLMDDYSVLPIQIYYWAKEPIDRAAQINFQNVAAAGIVVLLAVLLTFNAIAILIRQLTSKPLS